MNVCGAAPLLLRAFVGCGEKMMSASAWRVFLRRPRRGAGRGGVGAPVLGRPREVWGADPAHDRLTRLSERG